jgi:hypothetical protein
MELPGAGAPAQTGQHPGGCGWSTLGDDALVMSRPIATPAKERAVKLGIVTDIHHTQPGGAPDAWHNPHQFETVATRLEQSLAWLRDRGVDRLAVLGDLTHRGDAASMREVLAIVAAAGLPAWVLPGNHDLAPDPAVLASTLAGAGHATLEPLGNDPVPFGPGWQVVGLGLQRREAGGYEAMPEPDPATWDDAPALVLAHFPVRSIRDDATAAGLKYAGDLANGDRLAGALRSHPQPVLVVHGHLHIRHAVADGALLQVSCGAQVESLFEATVLDLGGWGDGLVRWQATAIQDQWPGTNPALSGPAQTWRWTGSSWASVAPGPA